MRKDSPRQWGPPPTLAVVLGAAVGPDGRPTPALRRRAEAAARLYATGAVVGVIVTGGDKRSGDGVIGRRSEAALMADVLALAGVPAECVLWENRARTTRQNARYSLLLLAEAEQAGGCLVVVTDAWHLPRALLVFAVLRRRLGVSVLLRGHGVRPARPTWWWRLGWLREAVALPVDAVRVWWA